MILVWVGCEGGEVHLYHPSTYTLGGNSRNIGAQMQQISEMDINKKQETDVINEEE